MSQDLKKNISFLGADGKAGMNVLVHPRSLPDGMHPLIKNFFPYELGALEKRRGTRYLNVQTVAGKKSWVVSDTPRTPATVYVDSKTIPKSDIGIKSILATHFYTGNVRQTYGDEKAQRLFAVVDTYDVPVTGSETFSITEIAGGGSFTEFVGTTYFQLFWKCASGLKFVKEISTTVVAGNSYKFSVGNVALPANVQYAVIGYSKSSFTGSVASIPMYVIGTNGADLTITTEGAKIGCHVKQIVTTLPTDATEMLTYDYCNTSGLTALYSCDPTDDITGVGHTDFLSQVFVPQVVADPSFPFNRLCSFMPSGSNRLASTQGAVPSATEATMKFLFPVQDFFAFIEVSGYMHLPTIAAQWTNVQNTAGDNYAGWDETNDYVPPSGTYSGKRVWGGMWFFFYSPSLGSVSKRYGITGIGEGLSTSDQKALVTRTYSTPPRAKYACTYMGRVLCAGNPNNTNAVYHTSVISPDQATAIQQIAPQGAIGVGENAFYRANNATNVIGEEDGYGGDGIAINGIDSIPRVTTSATIEDVLLVFKRRSHFVITGDWNDEPAAGTSDLGTIVVKQLSKKIGLLSPMAKMHTNKGFFFLGENNLYGVNLLGEPDGVVPQMSPLLKAIYAEPRYSNDVSPVLLSYTFNNHAYLSLKENILRIGFGAVGLTSNVVGQLSDTLIRREVFLDLRPESIAMCWGPHEITQPGCPDQYQLGLVESANVFQLTAGTPAMLAKPQVLQIPVLLQHGSTYKARNGVFVSGSKHNLIAMDEDDYYTDLSYPICSEFISAEYVFGYPSLLKAFYYIGLTVDAQNTGVLYAMVTTDSGLDDLGTIDYVLNSSGDFDASNWDEIYWEGKTYPYKKIMLNTRPLGRSARVRMIHTGSENVKITNLELFYAVTRRSYL